MKLLRRNCVPLEYRACKGETEERDAYDRHTGRWVPDYDDPVIYRGNIWKQSGYVQYTYPGIAPDYIYVALLEDRNADIREDGQITWQGNTYKVLSVERTINFLSVTLQKLLTSGTEKYEEGTLYE